MKIPSHLLLFATVKNPSRLLLFATVLIAAVVPGSQFSTSGPSTRGSYPQLNGMDSVAYESIMVGNSMYAELRAADIGSFFWDLSVSEHTFGVLYANGSRTLAAEAIATELGDQ